MNRHMYLPPTDEGVKLALSDEQEQLCKVVYKETDEGFIFDGLWAPTTDYQDNFIIVPVRSVYEGIIPYKDREVFSNTIGSSTDPCPASSWLDLFRQKGIPCTSCATDGYFYDPRDRTAATIFTGLACNTSMVGGHIFGTYDNMSGNPGDSVILMPICSHHNTYCTDGTGRVGSGFFMMTRASGNCIKLKNYLR